VNSGEPGSPSSVSNAIGATPGDRFKICPHSTYHIKDAVCPEN
jgi:hypothetical protein